MTNIAMADALKVLDKVRTKYNLFFEMINQPFNILACIQ
jgi:hypothetical protein